MSRALLGAFDAFLRKADEPYKRYHRMADKAAPGVYRAFLAAVEALRGSVNLAAIEAALASRDTDKAMAGIAWDAFRSDLPGETLFGVFSDSAKVAGKTLLSDVGIAKAGEALEGTGTTASLTLPNIEAEVWIEAHTTLALVSQETADAIREIILRAQREGGAPRKTAREIRKLIGLTDRQVQAVQNYAEKLADSGKYLGPGGQERFDRAVGRYYDKLLKQRAETIAREETIRAAKEGNDVIMRQAISEGYLNTDEWQRRWLTTPDDRACPSCLAMHGQIAELDGPYPGGEMIPHLHITCVPGDVMVEAIDVQGAARSLYDGVVVEIALANGRRLTVTPNHMLLTRQGFVRADSLREGGDVIYTAGLNRELVSGPDDDDMPAPISQVFAFLLERTPMRLTSVPLAAEDFHGDGGSMNGNVDIVGADGLLRSAEEASGSKHLAENNLRSACVSYVAFPSQGVLTLDLKRLADAAHGLMSSHRKRPTFLRGETLHPQDVGLAAGSRGDAIGKEPMGDGFPRNSVLRAKSQHRHAITEILNNLCDWNRLRYMLSYAAKLNPRLMKKSPDGRCRASMEFAEALGACSSFVSSEQIVEINRKPFVGHVYDLQTVSTVYSVNGVLGSNCRCAESVERKAKR